MGPTNTILTSEGTHIEFNRNNVNVWTLSIQMNLPQSTSPTNRASVLTVLIYSVSRRNKQNDWKSHGYHGWEALSAKKIAYQKQTQACVSLSKTKCRAKNGHCAHKMLSKSAGDSMTISYVSGYKNRVTDMGSSRKKIGTSQANSPQCLPIYLYKANQALFSFVYQLPWVLKKSIPLIGKIIFSSLK